MDKQRTSLQRLIAATAVPSLALTAFGADKPAAPPAAVPAAKPAKPAWLTDVSVGVKEAYDDNLLGVSGKGVMDPQSSWVTTVSPKLGFNLAPLFGNSKTIPTLAFGYAPDFVTYHDDPSAPNGSRESYNIHRITTAIKGKVAGLSYNLDNAFAYIDGDKEGPTYTGLDSTRSAYATSMARERRNQFQDRAKISFQYDFGKAFVRPAAAVTYYDLLTLQQNVAGYQNYVDRYDANGGADVGFKVMAPLAVTLGYRYGHQHQEAFQFGTVLNRMSSPNDYHRVLAGIEGKPWKWLTVALQAGPDFRSYEDRAPVKDQDPTKFYGEANVVADVTANDAITFKWKQWQWVASTGRVPYYDSSFDLSYRHKFTKTLNVEAGARMLTADYTTGSAPRTRRYDLQYSVAASVNYALTPNMALNLAYAYDMGRNGEGDLRTVVEDYREYDRQSVALGVVFKY